MWLKSQIPPQMDCGRTQTSSLGCSGGMCGWWACRLWRCVWSLSSFSPRCCRCLGWSPLCPHWGEGLGPDITKQFNQSSCHVWTNNMLLQVHTPYILNMYIHLGIVHICQLLIEHLPGRPNYDQEWSIVHMWSSKLWCMMIGTKSKGSYHTMMTR